MARRALVFAVALSALAIVMGLTIGDADVRARFLAYGCLIFFIPLGTVLHELAHGLADLVLGLRLFSLSYGLTGRVLYRRRLGTCALEIRSSLSGGFALAAPRSTRWLRLRWSLVVAAAPLANALLAAAAFSVSLKSPIAEGVVRSFGWANAILLGLSLFPFKYATPFGVSPSDGLGLFTIPFSSADKLKQTHAHYFALEGMECLRQKNYAAAESWARRGLEACAGELSNRTVLGLALLGNKRLSEARDLFLELAESTTPPANSPPCKALFLNNVAYIDLMTEDEKLLEEADRYSQQAMRLNPWDAYIKGTRGSVLVTLGRLDEGIGLLEQAIEEHEEPENKASNACWLSIAFRKAGNLEASHRLLNQARQLDPECEYIPFALKESARPERGAEAAERHDLVAQPE